MTRLVIFITILILYFIRADDTFNHSDATLINNDETNLEELEHKAMSCSNGKCINKCCPEGQFIRMKKCVKRNIKIGFPIISVYDKSKTKTGKKVAEVLTIVSGKLLDEEFKNKSINPVYLDYRPYIIENGDLQLEVPNIYDRWTLVTKDKYCVDYCLTRRGIRKSPTFLVITEDQVQLPSQPYKPYVMLLSSFFLFLVLLVYFLLPDLQNICGKILMAYVFSLFMASLLMATIEFEKGHHTACSCILLTGSIYYFLLATFCWMSVMSCDIWWTFRSYAKARLMQHRKEHFKFFMYCLFAWGVPLVMTIGLLGLNNANVKHLPWLVIPQIPDRGCFLENGVKYLYLYIPMLILITCNWILYLMTAFYLWRLGRGTAILDSPNTTSGHNIQRNRFMMYLKLSVVMGLNWIFEIVSFKFPEYKIWYITDFFNIFIGFTIFLIYVCKQKILRMLYKRWVQGYTSVKFSSFKDFNTNSDCSNPEATQNIFSNSKGLKNITVLRFDESDMKSSLKSCKNIHFESDMKSSLKSCKNINFMETIDPRHTHFVLTQSYPSKN